MIRGILAFILALTFSLTHADCTPLRDKCGNIKRSSHQVKLFKQANPCPATGLPYGRCDGYEVDHIVPLSCCGMDRPENMQWLTLEAHDAKTLIDNRVCKVR